MQGETQKVNNNIHDIWKSVKELMEYNAKQ